MDGKSPTPASSEDAYECDGCGACCQSYAIFASEGDALREPRIRDGARKLQNHQKIRGWAWQLFPLPFLEGCCFLDEQKKCKIYSTRPDVCRRFPAGDPKCQDARELHGLPPLLPVSAE